MKENNEGRERGKKRKRRGGDEAESEEERQAGIDEGHLLDGPGKKMRDGEETDKSARSSVHTPDEVTQHREEKRRKEKAADSHQCVPHTKQAGEARPGEVEEGT